MDPEVHEVAELFALMAEVDFNGVSPLYERLTLAATHDEAVLALMLATGPGDRLPHLLLASVQHLLLRAGDDVSARFRDQPDEVFLAWCREHLDPREDAHERH